MVKVDLYSIVSVMLYAIYLIHHVNACRINSEKFKNYAKKSIEHFLDVAQLESIYWPDEPLNEVTLSKVLGLNISLAETRFNLEIEPSKGENAVISKPASLLLELFTTCSADRGSRGYTLTLNLELANPFKVIDLHLKPNEDNREGGLFRIHLPNSTLLVQLNQRISYDECLEVNYVQLAPNVAYQAECLKCTTREQDQMDKMFSRKMPRLDNEIDSTISDKLLLGLQTLLNQQRLDLDLYL